jgi:hypothetical protein
VGCGRARAVSGTPALRRGPANALSLQLVIKSPHKTHVGMAVGNEAAIEIYRLRLIKKRGPDFIGAADVIDLLQPVEAHLSR